MAADSSAPASSAPAASPTAPAPADADARPRAALHTLGCRLNAAETDLIRRQLEGAGYQVVPWGEQADLCVVNTCTVTAQADAKSRQALRAVRRSTPAATLAVTGCYAQRQPEALARQGLADLVLGNAEKLRLLTHLDAPAAAGPPAEPAGPRVVAPRIPREAFRVDGFDAGALITSDGDTRAHLKIQDGCDFMCTFCVIPAVRGRARPRALDDLRAEAEALAAAGYREVVLTGVNLGTYADAGCDLVGVVDALNAIPGLARIRISSIEPTTVDAGLLARMADGAHRLVPFLHLPLQSGAATVLAAMRRRYGPVEWRAFADQALARVPGLCLGTDVMVGFPGEDDDAFAETVALLESLPLAYAHVFPYSARAGTPAPRLPDPVPAPVRQRRAAVLRALSERKREAFHRRHLGRRLPVLFEQPRASGVAQGYTENFIRVEVAVSDAVALRNRIASVQLLEAGPARVAGVLAAEP
ncbi:MAG TPA: tRNA (N(6)-L-threonylcarbamoyladenosine(37)-C(2))-methylthiotransferase MtaB [bacterium]|nr:tRNA (N(6)-L-threonylcarbamoyladenosine(37)-C(2))-methylthiotransferase MtaB [bacterium]